MKQNLLLILLMMSTNTFAATTIIYGEDNRQEIKDLENKKITEIGKSVAGRIYKYSFQKNEDDTISFENIMTLSDPYSHKVCKDEKFAEQPTVSDCTGFLVGEDLLVTAGHCVADAGSTVEGKATQKCSMFSWLFDYKVEANGVTKLDRVSENRLYDCKEVVIAKYTEHEDFALIRLDRKVTDRKPLRLKQKGVISKRDKVYVIGHPSGLPLKYTGKADVFSVNVNYFRTNLDTFGGNSGSPVFDADTNEVAGILVRGDVDYVMSERNGETCQRVNICDEEMKNCKMDDPNIKGEHVSHINSISEYL